MLHSSLWDRNRGMAVLGAGRGSVTVKAGTRHGGEVRGQHDYIMVRDMVGHEHWEAVVPRTWVWDSLPVQWWPLEDLWVGPEIVTPVIHKGLGLGEDAPETPTDWPFPSPSYWVTLMIVLATNFCVAGDTSQSIPECLSSLSKALGSALSIPHPQKRSASMSISNLSLLCPFLRSS